MPDNAGTANTPKITEVANTGTYEKIELKHPEKVCIFHISEHDFLVLMCVRWLKVHQI